MNANIEHRSEEQAFRLEMPEDFNFAFDVVGRRAREADRTAVIAVDKTGGELARLSYADLDRESNRFANVLSDLGAKAADYAFVASDRCGRGLAGLDIDAGSVRRRR